MKKSIPLLFSLIFLLASCDSPRSQRAVIGGSNNQLQAGNINYIFCSDTYLLEINKSFLNHNYFTDVISFDYCSENVLNGDIFISLETVYDNAVLYNVSKSDELIRVIIHGLLHLLKFNDKDEFEKIVMKSKEDEYLLSYKLLLNEMSGKL